MQIFVNGHGEKDFAPDQVMASAVFDFHATSYDEALKGGVKKVKEYIAAISEATDFDTTDFKTNAYSVCERTHINQLNPTTEADLDKNLQKRVSDGFFFSQYIYIVFDYDRDRLANLLLLSSKSPSAPRLHIEFGLKDRAEKQKELIARAYEDAESKAMALAVAAGKHLRDCVRVEIDHQVSVNRDAAFDGAALKGAVATSGKNYEAELKNIDETFNPDDIPVSKQISCVWETSD